jgi:hypothetical protein
MHLVHRTSADRYINRSALQHMAASFSIRGQEMEVVSGDAKRARKPGRPKANERALLIFETEFFLSRRRNFEVSTLRDRFHNPGLHEGEFALNAKGIEHVLRRPESITYRYEFGEAVHVLESLCELGTEASHDRIRNEAIAFHSRNCSIGRHAVTNALQDNHFSIEIDECTETEVTMMKQARNTNRALVKPFYERCRGRNLEQGMDGSAQTLRECQRHHMITADLVGIHTLDESCIERVWEVTGNRLHA